MKLETNVVDSSANRKLPEQTQRVYLELVDLSKSGVLSATMDDLAMLVGLSRKSLQKHIARLREARLFFDLESRVQPDGSLAKYRKVVVPATWGVTTENAKKVPGLCPRVVQRETPEGGDRGSQWPLYMHLENMRTCTLLPSGVAMRRCAPTAGLEDTMNANEALANLFEGKQTRKFDLNHLPPYPDAGLVKPVEYPAMPTFHGKKYPDGEMCVSAFRAVIKKYYGKRPALNREEKIKLRHRLAHAADFMFKNGITRPHGWADFRMHQWQAIHERQAKDFRKKRPSIHFVFAVQAVEKNLKLYRRVKESHEVLHKVELTPSHERLVGLWEECRMVCSRPVAEDLGEVTTRRLAAEVLPDSVYQELTASAADERECIMREIYQKMGAKEWVW